LTKAGERFKISAATLHTVERLVVKGVSITVPVGAACVRIFLDCRRGGDSLVMSEDRGLVKLHNIRCILKVDFLRPAVVFSTAEVKRTLIRGASGSPATMYIRISMNSHEGCGLTGMSQCVFLAFQLLSGCSTSNLLVEVLTYIELLLTGESAFDVEGKEK